KNGRRLWQRSFVSAITFTNANNYCNNLNLDGLTGWRVPALSELAQTILKAGGLMGCAAGYCCPSTDQAVFPFSAQPVDDLFWTNTSGGTGLFDCLNYDDGRSNFKEPVTATHNVRCTHDPAPGY